MIVWSRYQNGTYALGFFNNIWLNVNTAATSTVFGSSASSFTYRSSRGRR